MESMITDKVVRVVTLEGKEGAEWKLPLKEFYLLAIYRGKE